MTGRMIYKATWEDEFFTSLSVFHRLLWIGLITSCADDQGRLQDSPTLIRSRVFPLDDVPIQDIKTGLDLYCKEGKIVRYIASGKHVIQIVSWWKHQTPRWAGKSSYPPPPSWTDRERYHGQDNVIITKNWTSKGGYIEGYIADNTKRDINDDVNDDDDVEGDKKPAPPPQTFQDDAELERMFSEVTSWMTIPSGDRAEAIHALQVIRSKQEDPVEYMRPYYAEYKRRYNHGLRCFWLTEWAVTGNIPEAKNNKKPESMYHEVE